MAKLSGGTRTLSNNSVEWNRRRAEVANMKATGKYASVKFYPEGGGYVAVEKSGLKHYRDEYEAAIYLAKKGYKVTLIDESKGINRTPEGKLFIQTYEQRTPTGFTPKNMTNALRHARDKHADIAVIYMKRASHTRESVEQGIRDFKKSSKYRFKEMIVVTADGRLHRHKIMNSLARQLFRIVPELHGWLNVPPCPRLETNRSKDSDKN